MTQDRRGQRRRRRRRGPGEGAGEAAAPARRGRPRWRETIDSFGGFLTLGAVGGAVVLLVLLVVGNPLASVSEEPLLGEAVPLPPGREASHTANPADVVGRPGEPPASGPHFPQPLPAGIYDQPVADGNAVHSLEHGLVWITYNRELVDEAGLAVLEDVAGDFSRDVVLSPRPRNSVSIIAVSWGRILRLDGADEQQLRDFVRRNRDRSPEPGVR